MLRERKSIILYPNMLVMQDLLTRNGESTDTSYSPFFGLIDIIKEQFTGSARDRWSLDDFLEYLHDRDLDPRRINIQERVVDLELQGKRNAGFTNLESMISSQEFVKEYIKNLMISYKKDSASPYNKNRYKTTMSFYDDDDTETTEADRLIVEKDYDLEEFNEAVNEIPYLLKLLHRGSCSMNAQLFSFIRAYQGIISNNKPNDKISPIDFSSYPLYRVRADGSIHKKFNHWDDNKGVDYPAARRWICGENQNDIYYKAAMRLLTAFDILELNILDEDPLDYTAEYINSLMCTYLPTNEEYLDNFSALDPELQIALNAENFFTKRRRFKLSTYEQMHINDAEFVELVRIRLKTLRDIDHEKFSRWENKFSKTIDYVSEVYSHYEGNGKVYKFDERDFQVSDGLIMINGQWLKLNAKHIGPYNGDNNPVCLLTDNGICILLENSFEEIHYRSIEDALLLLKSGGELGNEGWYEC